MLIVNRSVSQSVNTRRSANETKTLERQHREWRTEQEQKPWEDADNIREMRKALRATRFWPSREIRRARSMYEQWESIVGKMNKLGRPRRPSWRIPDDAEFELFLKRFYVDPFL